MCTKALSRINTRAQRSGGDRWFSGAGRRNSRGKETECLQSPRRALKANSAADPSPVISSASKCLTRACCRVLFPLHLPAILIDPILPTPILPPSGPTEISDGMEVSDELSGCSDHSYDTYTTSASTPADHRRSGSRTKTLTDRDGR